MKIIPGLVLILASFPVFATSDLMCSGNEYDVYLGVGVDEHGNGDVGFVSVTSKNTDVVKEYFSNKIKTVNLKWLDGEEDFSKNTMEVVLYDINGSSIKITAQGVNGKLLYKQKKYSIVCNWEM